MFLWNNDTDNKINNFLEPFQIILEAIQLNMKLQAKARINGLHKEQKIL
jgi:hypothetical protein